jgi:hypothetical protein
MSRTLFPELRKVEQGDLIGLKIVKVVTNLYDAVKMIQCQDNNGEIHEITFRPVDKSCIDMNWMAQKYLILKRSYK